MYRAAFFFNFCLFFSTGKNIFHFEKNWNIRKIPNARAHFPRLSATYFKDQKSGSVRL